MHVDCRYDTDIFGDKESESNHLST